MSKIVPTGNAGRDISTIMDELNNVSEGQSNFNGLTLASFGTITVNYTGGTFSKITQINHNLGYTPFFIVRAITYNGNNPTQVSDALITSDYSYGGNTPKINSGYPEAYTQFVATNTTFGVIFVDVGGGGSTLTGLYGFQYYLFTRPIGKNS